ncbi:unnamed protein product [Miscanthus lutarioriparius]|uniref:RING-type domain-containing protein n=1 Tax=Miscanthus lutarioriparius TaxID=422564 RepID=A0A811PJ26_9POAL|nr:unnamed protein product [Miscanthus lutarioriparius]
MAAPPPPLPVTRSAANDGGAAAPHHHHQQQQGHDGAGAEVRRAAKVLPSPCCSTAPSWRQGTCAWRRRHAVAARRAERRARCGGPDRALDYSRQKFWSFTSSSSSLSDDPDNFDFIMDPHEARAYLSRLVVFDLNRPRPRDGPFDVAAAAVSVLQQHGHGLGGGGEPPATAASIAALPTVEVAEPAAVCAICKDDLPLTSEARKLPCAHLYHSFCIVTWLQMHNSCPVCRFRIPSADDPPSAASASPPPTTPRTRPHRRSRTRRPP